MNRMNGYRKRVEGIVRENLSHQEMQAFPELTDNIINGIMDEMELLERNTIDRITSNINSHGFKQWMLGNYELSERRPKPSSKKGKK